MNIKDWKQYKKVLSEKMKDDEAFTLIELIVVMAILAILVLLAAPQFLGYTTKAKDAQIANDVAVAEMKTSENLIDHKWTESEFESWVDKDDNGLTFDKEYLKNIAKDKDGEGLYNKGGKLDPYDEDNPADLDKEIPEDEYRIVPQDFLDDEVSTNLDGTFFANDNGEVFYTPATDISGITSDGEEPSDNTGGQDSDGDSEELVGVDYGGYDDIPGGVEWVNEMIDQDYEMAEDNDFMFIYDYWYYTGDKDKFIIPMYIKGELVTSHDSMFGELSRFNKLSVASNNPNVESTARMFYRSSMTELDLSEYDTSSVTNMSRMFQQSKVTELDLSGFNTSNVTDMADMFTASSVTELNLSGFNTSKVTNMSQMFQESNVTNLDLSGLVTSNVTNMRNMFYHSNITELNLIGFDTSNVTDMSGMFSGARTSHLDLRSFAISNATNVEYMFSWSPIETVVVSTQEIADTLRNETDAPSGITFTAIND